MKKLILLIAVVLALAVAGYFLFEENHGQSTVWLDVRTREEWDEGRVAGAVHFDLERLNRGELPDISKDSDISVYCRSGNRAEQAKLILEKAGYKSVSNAGGLSDISDNGVKVCSAFEQNCNR